jgi:serine/threonine protein kinase
MNGINNSPQNNFMSPNSSLTEETPTEGITVCGTPDYLSPELLLGTGHEYTVDWWAVGVILFEMLTGCPPFNDETPELIFDNILSCKIPWPGEGLLPERAVDLIKKLLVTDPKKRLGYNGADEVKKHPFFKGIKWDKLLKQRPPYVPYIESEESTQHFAPRQSIFVVEDSNIDDTEETESGEMTEEPTNILSNNSSFEDMLSPMSQSPIDFSFVSASNLAEMNKQVYNKMENTIPERSP